MVNSIFLFPGQGAQYPGMGHDLWERFGRVKKLFRLASEICGKDMERLLFEASEQELKQTVNTQMAVTLVNASVREVLQEDLGIRSVASAGFSLGELSALYDAEAMAFEELIQLVKYRAETMDACSRFYEDRQGGPAMAAVIGLDFSTVQQVIAGAKTPRDVYAANDNSPRQVVVSGLKESVDEIQNQLIEAGAKRVIPLKVSGPFHTPLMEDAGRMFKEALESVAWKPLKKPCCANATGGFYPSSEAIRQLCVDQITSPVQWVSILNHLKELSFDAALETGPGKVLTGLWKGVEMEVPCYPVGTAEQLEGLPIIEVSRS